MHLEKIPIHSNARRPAPIRYTAPMGILIGMDEAGYGPNFGPLVVAATAWHVREDSDFEVQDGEIASATGHRVRSTQSPTNASTQSASVAVAPPKPKADYIALSRLPRPTISKSASDRRIAIADSKELYTPGLGLRQLERGVH